MSLRFDEIFVKKRSQDEWKKKGLANWLKFYNFQFCRVYTMNRNGKSELVYVWGEILLRKMVFAHH
jgi:hypothetical protein